LLLDDLELVMGHPLQANRSTVTIAFLETRIDVLEDFFGWDDLGDWLKDRKQKFA
jgi:hypothetical protein